MAYQPPENLACGFCLQEAVQSQSFFSASAAPDVGLEASASEDAARASRFFRVQYACAACGVRRTRNIGYQNGGDGDNDVAAHDRVHAFELVHASWPAGRPLEKLVHFREVVAVDDFAAWGVVPRRGRASFGHDEAEACTGFGVGAVYKMLPAPLAGKEEDVVGEEAELEDDENVVQDKTVSGEEAELEDDENVVHDKTVSGEAVTWNGEASSSEKAELQEIECFEMNFLSDLEDSNKIEGSEPELINGNGKRRRESDAWSQISELLEEKVDPTWRPSASKKSKTGSKHLAKTDVAAEPKPRPAHDVEDERGLGTIEGLAANTDSVDDASVHGGHPWIRGYVTRAEDCPEDGRALKHAGDAALSSPQPRKHHHPRSSTPFAQPSRAIVVGAQQNLRSTALLHLSPAIPMDRPLDDVISERQRGGYRGRNRRGNNDSFPRDGVRKSHRDDSRNIDRDWVHDRFEGDNDNDTRRPQRNRRPDRNARLSPPEFDKYGTSPDLFPTSSSPHPSSNTGSGQQVYKIRIDNLHYDIPEDDLRELFERIGPVLDCWLLYDRSDRSRGVGFVTYSHISDARLACREYDGANAKGQPIRLSLLPNAQSKPARANPFDTAQRPGRSLFERIEPRDRSLSPQRGPRHSDVSKPAPSNIDRYVPGQGGSRSRSPAPRRGGREAGRRPGARREGTGRGGRRDDGGRPVVQGRPRKTADELDAEMEDYWGAKNEGAAANGNMEEAGPAGGAHVNPGQAATSTLDDDIDMAVE